MLQDLGGDHQAYAVAINASGQSVGSYLTGSGYDAVLWSPSGTATVLQDAGGWPERRLAINASGHSVGYSNAGIGNGQDAVLWSPSGNATVLQDVGGQDISAASPSTTPGRASDIR